MLEQLADPIHVLMVIVLETFDLSGNQIGAEVKVDICRILIEFDVVAQLTKEVNYCFSERPKFDTDQLIFELDIKRDRWETMKAIFSEWWFAEVNVLKITLSKCYYIVSKSQGNMDMELRKLKCFEISNLEEVCP